MSSIVSDARRMFYFSIVIWMLKPSKERGELFPYHQLSVQNNGHFFVYFTCN